MIKTVIIESPFDGDLNRNSFYTRLCVLDSIRRGEAPVACHLVYPSLTTDLASMVRPAFIHDNSATSPLTRAEAFEHIEALRNRLEATIFYTDLGMSEGMSEARARCEEKGLPFEERRLPGFEAAMKEYDEERLVSKVRTRNAICESIGYYPDISEEERADFDCFDAIIAARKERDTTALVLPPGVTRSAATAVLNMPLPVSDGRDADDLAARDGRGQEAGNLIETHVNEKTGRMMGVMELTDGTKLVGALAAAEDDRLREDTRPIGGRPFPVATGPPKFHYDIDDPQQCADWAEANKRCASMECWSTPTSSIKWEFNKIRAERARREAAMGEEERAAEVEINRVGRERRAAARREREEDARNAMPSFTFR